MEELSAPEIKALIEKQEEGDLDCYRIPNVALPWVEGEEGQANDFRTMRMPHQKDVMCPVNRAGKVVWREDLEPDEDTFGTPDPGIYKSKADFTQLNPNQTAFFNTFYGHPLAMRRHMKGFSTLATVRWRQYFTTWCAQSWIKTPWRIFPQNS